MKRDKVYVLYTNHSVQPVGVFSDKIHALDYVYKMGLWGGIAEYFVDVPVLERVKEISKVSEKIECDPVLVARFSSAYIVRAAVKWGEKGEQIINDYDSGEECLLEHYLGRHGR